MEVSGDSIMGLMMLAAARGTSIDIVVDGTEAAALADALRTLVGGRFGEPN
jgi:phosphocarrier protein